MYIKEMNYEENMTGRKLLNLRDRQTDRHTNNICDNVTLMGMVRAGQEMGQSVMDHESNWVALVMDQFPLPHAPYAIRMYYFRSRSYAWACGSCTITPYCYCHRQSSSSFITPAAILCVLIFVFTLFVFSAESQHQHT